MRSVMRYVWLFSLCLFPVVGACSGHPSNPSEYLGDQDVAPPPLDAGARPVPTDAPREIPPSPEPIPDAAIVTPPTPENIIPPATEPEVVQVPMAEPEPTAPPPGAVEPVPDAGAVTDDGEDPEPPPEYEPEPEQDVAPVPPLGPTPVDPPVGSEPVGCSDSAPNYDGLDYMYGGPVVCMGEPCDGLTSHPTLCGELDWVNDDPITLTGSDDHQIVVFTDSLPDMVLTERCVMTIFPDDWETPGCTVWSATRTANARIEQRWEANPGWAHIVVGQRGTDLRCPFSCPD